MQRLTVCFAIIAVLLCGVVSAQVNGSQYVNGVEGLKAASLPPPGVYWLMYNVNYHTSDLCDASGNGLPVGLDTDVLAMVHRLVYMTNTKILGADYGMDVVVPLIHTDFELGAAGINDDDTGLGDINVEPFVLGWHNPRSDLAFAVGFYLPTGSWSEGEPAKPGKDYWSTMLSLGGTYYFDEAKTVSASILSRYEIHNEMDSSDVTPGDDFHFEWGVGKTVGGGLWNVGVAGYAQWQVGDDSGADVTWDRSVHDRVFAVGPEINRFFPKAKLGLSFRILEEFDARDRPEGRIATLTLAKIL